MADTNLAPPLLALAVALLAYSCFPAPALRVVGAAGCVDLLPAEQDADGPVSHPEKLLAESGPATRPVPLAAERQGSAVGAGEVCDLCCSWLLLLIRSVHFQ